MLSSWFVLALGAGLSSVVFGTLNRVSLRNGNDSTAYGWWFEISRLVVFSVLVLFDYRMSWTWQNGFILFLVGITELFAVYLFMKLHAKTNLSVSAIVIQFRLIIVPLAAFLILGEVLSLPAYVGFIVLMTGILCTVSLKDIRDPAQGIKYGLLFALPSALSSILIKLSTSFASVSVISLAYALVPVLFLPLLMKDAKPRILSTWKQYRIKGLLATIANSVTLLLLGFAYKVGTASQISGVFASTFVVTVLVGAFHLKERVTTKQVVGILLVLAALILLY